MFSSGDFFKLFVLREQKKSGDGQVDWIVFIASQASEGLLDGRTTTEQHE